MSPTPGELELGEKIYRQVRLYEKSMKDIRGKRWLHATCIGLLFLALILEVKPTSHEVSSLFPFLPACVGLIVWQYRQARVQYATQKLVLRLLEDKYGEALPWVVEEKQLAQARELEGAALLHPSPASHSS